MSSKLQCIQNTPSALIRLIVKIIATLLFIISIGVLFSWHNPKLLTSTVIHNQIVVMAYNTAICTFLAAAALFAIIYNQIFLMRTCGALILIISGLTLLELLGGVSLNINYWFMQASAQMPTIGNFMSPTTATCFILTSSSLLLLSIQKNSTEKVSIIFVIFLNLMTVTITVIAILGHGIGLVPAFVWLGIKMAPHTALSLFLFSLAIILYIKQDSANAFNRLKFFNRMITGFGFMAILVAAIGSIAIMQINTVSSITQKIYQNPNDIQTHRHEFEISILKMEDDAKSLVILSVVGFLIVGLSVSILITRSLTNQLKNIRHAMLNISQGKLDDPIPYLDHTQEIGDMARTLAIFSANITARNQLEKRLSQVIEAMPNGVIVINDSGVIEIANHQTETIFGYPPGKLVGQPIEVLIPHNTAEQHPHNRDTFLKNPSPRPMGAGRELYGLHSNGSEFPVEIGLVPIETSEGIKVLASIVDISERINSARALNESRERLEIATHVNAIGVWEYDVETGKLIWNDAMFDIYGRKKKLFTHDYHAWQQCVHPADIEETEKELALAQKKLAPFAHKFRIIKPDGEIRVIHAKAKTEFIKNSKRMLGTNIDITREEQTFAKLHELEALRSAIVEYSEDAIISKTPQGVITSWNAGAQSIFGYAANEVIGKKIVDVLFPEDRKHEEEEMLQQVRAGIVVRHYETIRRCKNGRLINVSVTLSPIKDGNGNTIGISAVKRDITETIRINEMLAERQIELQHSNKELARSNSELENFAYIASHDLKSPLRGISQLSMWIDEDIANKEFSAIAEHTNMLQKRIQRMEKLLDDLLIFYRAGKSDGALIQVDINLMVEGIFESQNNKPGLHLEIVGTLPKFTTLSTPLEQVIRNLFSNAIKHHDRDTGLIQISCKKLNANYFEFSVSDDGPGIPQQYHQRIFGMFQTLKPRDEMEGSGVGLALIKKIVENYGGHVTVTSKERGCCFSFSWPENINRRNDNG